MILLSVGGSIYTSNTLHLLKELGLDTQEAHETYQNYMLTLPNLRGFRCLHGQVQQ